MRADLTPLIGGGLTLEGDARVNKRDELCLSRMTLHVGGADGVTVRLRGRIKIAGARAAFGEVISHIPTEEGERSVKEA